MKATLKVYENADCTSETLIRYENVIGSPIVAASVIESPDQGAGNTPPDEFDLEFLYNLTLENTEKSFWECRVTCKDGRAYAKATLSNGIDLNNIIPGTRIVIGDLAVDEVYLAKVFIGWNPGIIVAGNASQVKRMWVKNIGDSGYDARIRILPKGEFENIVGNPIRSIVGEKFLRETRIGNYALQVKADIGKIDVHYRNYESDEVCLAEVSIIADGETSNEIATGIYVVFNEEIFEGYSATIQISDGCERVQIAEDCDGSPDEFGCADVVFGNMGSGESDSFWVQIVTNSGDSPSANPRHANLQARITDY